MKKKIFWIIAVLVVIILVAIGLKSAGVIGKDEGIKVATEKVVTRTIIETVNASGKVYPEIEVKVSPDISGEIVELSVEEGDSVKRGQVLAKIYADIYSTQRNQAEAEVQRMEAMLANSQAQLVSLKSSLELAKKNYDRQKQLLNDKVISAAEFEQAENNYRTAQASYNAALEDIRSAQAAIQSSRASLERANKDLSRTAVLAPMDGVVSLLSVKKGERVVGSNMMAGTEMMRIADMNTIEVQVDVSENDIPKVSLGDSALVEVEAYTGRKFKGIVSKIASSSNTVSGTAAAGANDVTNYKVHIRLLHSSYHDLIDPTKPRHFPFRPGMNASADIQTMTKENVIAAAINAVTTREPGTDNVVNAKKDPAEEEGLQEQTRTSVSQDIDEVVFVLQPDNTVKKVKVKTGIQDINYIEITEGLQGGETIVVAPYNVVSKTLKDGQKVKVVPQDKLFETRK